MFKCSIPRCVPLHHTDCGEFRDFTEKKRQRAAFFLWNPEKNRMPLQWSLHPRWKCSNTLIEFLQNLLAFVKTCSNLFKCVQMFAVCGAKASHHTDCGEFRDFTEKKRQRAAFFLGNPEKNRVPLHPRWKCSNNLIEFLQHLLAILASARCGATDARRDPPFRNEASSSFKVLRLPNTRRRFLSGANGGCKIHWKFHNLLHRVSRVLLLQKNACFFRSFR